ncbi:MAG TPA: hypothetical protein VJB67_00010 [Patescibacteria group bacterium]|nr:hypothetical protein [Patescibacteria group bacterium]
MVLNNSNSIAKLEQTLGFLFSYFLFGTILYLILSLSGKLPIGWTYWHITALTLAITAIGASIKKIFR